ncbi:MAG: FTR1 family protein [Alphaproteobacteria bacterium]|nr:FTR1 family protein [Alphaproteobacteria bacterium]
MMRRLIWLALLVLTAFPVRAADTDLAAAARTLAARGDQLIAAYDPTHGRATGDAFSDLYFDVFEESGLEQAIGVCSASDKTALEALFGEIIGLAGQGRPPAELQTRWNNLKALLETATIAALEPPTGPFQAFLQSLLILLREGIEAMLVVTALVAAWLFDRVIHLSGAGQEVLEGAILLISALVLFHVSFWLLSKREAATWQAYVQGQVAGAAQSGRMWTLGLAAFLAVFREGAETVLFYQALAQSSPGQGPALVGGFVVAAIALAVLYLAMRHLSLRLPLGLFFTATAGLLFVLAVSFAGKGVLELQEGRWLPITPLDGWPRLEWLGLFPTAEGLAAQALLLAPMLAALAWHAARRKRLPA